MTRRPSRVGFTLIELLVVISIIGMLMALLLPAIQAAREAGWANTCRNNQRNLAIAIFGYDSKHNQYPAYNPRYFGSDESTVGVRPLIYAISPFLERNDIFEAYNVDSHGAKPIPPFGMEILHCPSDPETLNDSAGTAFVYNMGFSGAVNSNGATKPPGLGYGIFGQGSIVTTGSPPNDKKIPVSFSASSAFLLTHDGTTHTVMLSENVDARFWNETDPKEWHRVGFVWRNIKNGGKWKINGTLANEPGASGSPAWGGKVDWARPSAYHPEVVNVAFCDAHVRTIDDDINYDVWAQLMTCDGIGLARKPSTKKDVSNLPTMGIPLDENLVR